MLSVLGANFLGFQDSRIPGFQDSRIPRIPGDNRIISTEDSRIPRIPGFPGFLGIPSVHTTNLLWSILRGNGAHTPIQDLESYESIIREVLTTNHLCRPSSPRHTYGRWVALRHASREQVSQRRTRPLRPRPSRRSSISRLHEISTRLSSINSKAVTTSY